MGAERLDVTGTCGDISRSFEQPAGNATEHRDSFDLRLLSLCFPNFSGRDRHPGHGVSRIHYASRPLAKLAIVDR